MNAALVLMAAACVAGSHGSTPVATSGCCSSHSYNYSYGGDCGCQDDCGRQGLLDRLRGHFGGLFNRGGCGCETSCDTGCGGGGGLFHRRSSYNDCCDTGCDDPCARRGFNFGGRLRGLFHRNNDCCDPCGGHYGAYGTSGCCGSSTHGVPVGGEKIAPPKAGDPMPNPADGKKGGGNNPAGNEPPVNNNTIDPQPIGSPNNLEIVPPAIVPPIPGNFNGKTPF